MNSIPQNLPSVSIIIPTRNRELVIGECLDRVISQIQSDDEIIVIDSSSNNETQVLIKNYPMVIYIQLGNVPFSIVMGRNRGISEAQNENLIFIDDDCYVLPGWLKSLKTALLDQSIAAVGGRIIYDPWKKVNIGEPVALLDISKDIIWAEWDRIVDTPIDVDHLPGGNFAVRRQVAVEIGMFDTNFIGSANLEETDFFLRVRKTGGKLLFLPSAVVEHRAAKRADNIERSLTNYYYRFSMVRNRLYFLRKHKSSGLGKGLKRQIVDLLYGTNKLFLGSFIFMIASLYGIVNGMTVKITNKINKN